MKHVQARAEPVFEVGPTNSTWRGTAKLARAKCCRSMSDRRKLGAPQSARSSRPFPMAGSVSIWAKDRCGTADISQATVVLEGPLGRRGRTFSKGARQVLALASPAMLLWRRGDGRGGGDSDWTNEASQGAGISGMSKASVAMLRSTDTCRPRCTACGISILIDLETAHRPLHGQTWPPELWLPPSVQRTISQEAESRQCPITPLQLPAHEHPPAQ